MRTYNNIIYGGVNIYLDLCAVEQADLLRTGLSGPVELAGGLSISHHVQQANRHSLNKNTQKASQHRPTEDKTYSHFQLNYALVACTGAHLTGYSNGDCCTYRHKTGLAN